METLTSFIAFRWRSFDAELRNFDFKGIDLKQYNIDGATINSEILQLQGLYDGTYFSSIKRFWKQIQMNLWEVMRL